MQNKSYLFFFFLIYFLFNQCHLKAQTCEVVTSFDSANNRMIFYANDSSFNYSYLFIVDDVQLLENLTGGKSAAYYFLPNDTLEHSVCFKIVDLSSQTIFCEQCINFIFPQEEPIEPPSCSISYSVSNDSLFLTVFDVQNNAATNWQINGEQFQGETIIYQLPFNQNNVQIIVYASNFAADNCIDTLVIENPFYIPPDSCKVDFEIISDGLKIFFINKNKNVNFNHSAYTWNFGDGTTGNLMNEIHYYNSPGIYNVCFSVYDTLNLYCRDTICRSIIVSEQNNNINCEANFITSQTDEYHVNLINISSGTNLIFTWDFGEGINSIITGPNPSYVYNETGNYFVCLTISGENCQSTFCDTIKMGADGIINRTSQGFTVNVLFPDEFITNIKQNDANKASVTAFPIPTNDMLYINSILPIKLIEIFNMDGMLIMQSNGPSISLYSIASGMYYARINQQQRIKILKN